MAQKEKRIQHAKVEHLYCQKLQLKGLLGLSKYVDMRQKVRTGLVTQNISLAERTFEGFRLVI